MISSKKLKDTPNRNKRRWKIIRVLKLEPKKMDITLFGTSQDLKNITSKDIEVSVDISNLTEGEHDIQLSVKAPTSIEWELSSPTATVLITRKKAT